ncbi:GGDEF domain-containing protein [Vibrio salinus]|uniref:GGDEF domain-containing protein n=1 Tax=Vibrio salinus TaxID=2899784 RepID=UPI001E3F165B|nr:GGDEF domain-containing protein [Vibrio salinus]MCE0495024.1 GGDEF domain-containing protein [Vibrio salinus]
MEELLKKIKDTGLEATSVSGEEAVLFWSHVRTHIAETPLAQAQCWVISSEYRASLKQYQQCMDELESAINLLRLPQDAELVLSIKLTLCDRLIQSGKYQDALTQYVAITNIAIENGFIDEYATAVLGMGKLCQIYGDHNQALRFFQKVDGIDHAISSRSLRLQYKIGILDSYVALRRFSAAKELIMECEDLSILVSDKFYTGEVTYHEARMELAQGNVDLALKKLSSVSNSTSSHQHPSLSFWVTIELAKCFRETGQYELAEMLLMNKLKKTDTSAPPYMFKALYSGLADIFEEQGIFDNALKYQKKMFHIESDLMSKIPIGELGASQLKRISKFELQLKLILSEIENKELKETTEHHKNEVAQLQQDVFTDPLTRLHNRRWLEAKLKDLLLHEIPFAFLIIDIDHFKSINDELSHLVGDKAIIHVSQEIADYFKFHGASCVRFGGEEFLVILENTDINKALMHADHYRDKIYSYNWAEILGERGLTVSIGITLHKHGENTQRTFYRADKALYRAKANGRNQVCVEE